MTSFKDLGLSPEVLRGLEDLGFEKPSPIQAQTIPFLLTEQRDLIALAQTGTGKTAAFGLPILSQLDENSREPQAIVLCPTRELCLQISRDLKGFSKYIKGASISAVYGGERIDTQIRELRGGANVVVGTPGRVLDLIKRKVLKLQSIKWLVLDEADEMLDMGFKDDLDAILAETAGNRQTLLFSATMSPIVNSIARKYMNGPQEISVGKKNVGAEKVTHEYFVVHARDRYEALRRIVDSVPDIYGILFCRTRAETQEVADRLKEDRYSTEALHGEVSQNMRTLIMDRFRKRQIQLLVATDVAARGIDVSDLTHIINYNLPASAETYVHRSGRTGRADKAGVSISIILSKERRFIRELEHKTGKSFEQKPVPGGHDICEKQLFSLVDKITKIKINTEQIAPYLPAIHQKLEGLDRDELITHFVSAEFNHFLGLYQDAPDLNAPSTFGERDRGPRTFGGDEHLANIRLNLGRRDGFDIKALFGLINSQRALKGAEIGKVAVSDSFTIFSIDKRFAEDTLRSLRSADYRHRPVEASLTDESPQAGRPRRSGGFGARASAQGGRPGAKKFGKKKF